MIVLVSKLRSIQGVEEQEKEGSDSILKNCKGVLYRPGGNVPGRTKTAE